MPNASFYTDINGLGEEVLSIEDGKFQLARTISDWRRQDAHLAWGFTKWKDALAAIGQELAGVGWSSVKTLQNWIKIYEVYHVQLGLNPEQIVMNNSALNELLKVIDTKGKEFELVEFSDKEGKVSSRTDVETLVSEVMYLIAVGDKDREVANVVESYWPNYPTDPWKLAQVVSLVERIKGLDEEEEEDAQPKFLRRWHVAEVAEDSFSLIGFQIVRSGVEGIIAPLDQDILSKKELKQLVGKDEVVVEGVEEGE